MTSRKLDRKYRAPVASAKKVIAALLLTSLSSTTVLAETFNMANCRVSAVTFVDPWAKTTFEVEKVGTNYYYDCHDGKLVDEQKADGSCRQFGNLVLQGKEREQDSDVGQDMLAIYYVEPAAPCCGWQVLKPGSNDAKEALAEVTWLKPEEAPALHENGFASIDPKDGSNPKVAMRCDLSIPTKEPLG